MLKKKIDRDAAQTKLPLLLSDEELCVIQQALLLRKSMIVNVETPRMFNVNLEYTSMVHRKIVKHIQVQRKSNGTKT